MSKCVEKKILPWFFQVVENGTKTFEIRRDEDGFEVGDHINLCEWTVDGYTGKKIEVEITYILRDAELYGLKKGFCILGIKKLPTVQQTWPDWIPLTKESRPEKGGEYLVEFQGMSVGICMYLNGHFRNYGEIFDRMITRWMPLPKAKGEET